MTRKKGKEFIEEHKVEICIAVGVVAMIGVGIIGHRKVRSWKIISGDQNIKVTAEPIVQSITEELPYKEYRENLSGRYLIPTKLGEKMHVSPQMINKRLVSYGLQERLPDGEYMRTELGKAFGKDTWKVTGAGHSFSNIEWDESVLKIIFTEEERIAV